MHEGDNLNLLVRDFEDDFKIPILPAGICADSAILLDARESGRFLSDRPFEVGFLKYVGRGSTCRAHGSKG